MPMRFRKLQQPDILARAVARRQRRYQDQVTLSELLALDEEELRARKREHQRQSRLIRRAIRAKRTGGA